MIAERYCNGKKRCFKLRNLHTFSRSNSADSFSSSAIPEPVFQNLLEKCSTIQKFLCRILPPSLSSSFHENMLEVLSSKLRKTETLTTVADAATARKPIAAVRTSFFLTMR